MRFLSSPFAYLLLDHVPKPPLSTESYRLLQSDPASYRPLLLFVEIVGVGFLLTKTGRFPASGTRAASVLILNMTLPCLLWSKIVPSFNNDNISALGPIILTAFFYQGLSCALGMVAR